MNLLLFEAAFERRDVTRAIPLSVRPSAPDDANPSPGQDAHGVRAIAAACQPQME